MCIRDSNFSGFSQHRTQTKEFFTYSKIIHTNSKVKTKLGGTDSTWAHINTAASSNWRENLQKFVHLSPFLQDFYFQLRPEEWNFNFHKCKFFRHFVAEISTVKMDDHVLVSKFFKYWSESMTKYMWKPSSIWNKLWRHRMNINGLPYLFGGGGKSIKFEDL